MTIFLKQSTAVDIPLGPFVDSGDGFTPETTLTITQPDIRLKKGAAAWAQKNAAQTLSHEENGWYELALDTTDTGTLGQLMIAVYESGALPVWYECWVVTANVYDSLFAADVLDVSLVQIAGVVQSATDLKDFADDGYDPATNKVQGVVLADTVTTYTGNTPQTGDSFARIGATGSGLTSLATQASVNTIDDLLDSEMPALTTAVADLPTNAELATALGTADDAVLTAVAGVQADTDNIQTRLPAALTADGNIKADTLRVGGTLQTAGDLSAQIDTVDNLLDTELPALTTAVDALPTNAELATALGTADDATLAAIAALQLFVDTEVAAILAAVDTEIAAILVDTTNLNDTALADSVPADGALPTLQQAVYEIRQYLLERAVVGTTVTSFKVNGTTPLETFTIDHAVSPTTHTRTT